MHLTHRNIQAIMFVCLGWLSFSVADSCAKYLVQYYEPHKILFTNGVIGIVLTTIWILAAHSPKTFNTPRLKWHILRAICTTGSSFSVVTALGYMPIADFYGITFISPFVIALFSFLLLGEKVGWRRIMAMMVAFIGVLIVAGPQYESHNMGLFWAFLAPICLALNVLCVRKMGHHDPIALFAFFPFVGIAVFNIGFVAQDYQIPDINHLWIFVLATCSVMGGLIGTTVGFARATESAVVAPFLYTQILWGLLVGYFIFNTVPTQATFIGAGLVIIAGLYSYWREHQLAKADHQSL